MKKVAVIGGGASGTLVAIHLMRGLESDDELALYERSGEVGLGIAYSTVDANHLLNVRAVNLSLFPDEPEHFCSWLVSQGISDKAEVRNTFFPRMIYGQYIQSAYQAAMGQAKPRFQAHSQEVFAMSRVGSQIEVQTSEGRNSYDRIVLALGHLPTLLPQQMEGIAEHPRFILNPWSGRLDEIEPDQDVFIIGTGLTMVDQVMTLTDKAHRGRILARSRRGLRPQPHQLNDPFAYCLEEIVRPGILSRLLKVIRESGDNWRAGVDGLRPYTQQIWASLSIQEKRRFIRRLAPYWDVHRHRIPQKAADVLALLESNGQLTIEGGGIEGAGLSRGRFSVRLGGGGEVEADWIINCTGPDSGWRRAKLPLIESAVQAGLARYDELGMGIEVDADGSTEPTGQVWALGPICKGSRWETIAMPEVRVQAGRISNRI
jgi:uncharacterized NAD(P)/FAD-binding protein YdhS